MSAFTSKPRKLVLATAVSLLATVGSISVTQAEEMETVTERVSYIFGFNMGLRFKQDQVDIDPKAFMQALSDAAEGKEPSLTEEEMQSAMTAFQDKQKARQAAFIKEAAEKNTKEGDAFLMANAKKDGVKSTKSGLQYKVLTKGKGAKPEATDKVKVHYKGTLIDGTVFDSSYLRGEPAEFGVNQVIAGWTEALQLMKEGAKWEVYIPSDLAYGAGGSGPDIGPNATLVFEIELLEIK